MEVKNLGREERILNTRNSILVDDKSNGDTLEVLNVDALLQKYDTIDKLLNLPDEVTHCTYLVPEGQYEAVKACGGNLSAFLLLSCSTITFRHWLDQQEISCENHVRFLVELRDLLSEKLINPITAEKLVLVQLKLNRTDTTEFGFLETLREQNWFEYLDRCLESEDQFFCDKDFAADWSGWDGLPGVFKVSIALRRSENREGFYDCKRYLVVGELEEVKDFLADRDGEGFRVEQLATINSHQFAKVLPIKNATKKLGSLSEVNCAPFAKRNFNYLVEVKEPVRVKNLGKYTGMNNSLEYWFLHNLLAGERYAKIIVWESDSILNANMLVTVDLGEKFPKKLLEEKLQRVLLSGSKETAVLRLKEEIEASGIFAQNSGEMDSFTD